MRWLKRLLDRAYVRLFYWWGRRRRTTISITAPAGSTGYRIYRSFRSDGTWMYKVTALDAQGNPIELPTKISLK